MREFLIFSGLIYGSLAVGSVFRQLFPSAEAHSRRLTRMTMMVVETTLILLVFWGMDRELVSRYLPISLIAVIMMSVAGLAGYLVIRSPRRSLATQGAFVVSSLFSNVGPTMGGFLCMLYLGDRGLVVSQLFVLPAIPYYFSVVFSVARKFSGGQQLRFWQALRANFSDPIAILPLAATFIGFVLGVSGLEMPDVLATPRRVVVFVEVILFSFSFGLSARFRVMFRRLREYPAMLLVKLLVSPAVGLGLALAFGRTLSADPLAFKVIMIQSAMPVAIWSVAASKLFKLDEHLALGLWIFTTVCTAALVPAVAWLAGL